MLAWCVADGLRANEAPTHIGVQRGLFDTEPGRGFFGSEVAGLWHSSLPYMCILQSILTVYSRNPTLASSILSRLLYAVEKQLHTQRSQIMTTPAAMIEPEVARGLEGIVSHATHLSEVDGHAGRLTIRGYDMHALVGQVSFEEAAYLLWHGDLPNRHQLDALQRDMVAARHLPG